MRKRIDQWTGGRGGGGPSHWHARHLRRQNLRLLQQQKNAAGLKDFFFSKGALLMFLYAFRVRINVRLLSAFQPRSPPPLLARRRRWQFAVNLARPADGRKRTSILMTFDGTRIDGRNASARTARATDEPRTWTSRQRGNRASQAEPQGDAVTDNADFSLFFFVSPAGGK